MIEPIQFEMEFVVPRARLWQAWTNEADLVRWLAMKAHVRIEKGGPYELFWDPMHPNQNSTLGCVITDLEPEKKLVFEWKGPVHLADLMNASPTPTWVMVEFEDTNTHGSRVRLIHRGWEEGSRWINARSWQQQAWMIALQRLKQYLGN